MKTYKIKIKIYKTMEVEAETLEKAREKLDDMMSDSEHCGQWDYRDEGE